MKRLLTFIWGFFLFAGGAGLVYFQIKTIYKSGISIGVCWFLLCGIVNGLYGFMNIEKAIK